MPEQISSKDKAAAAEQMELEKRREVLTEKVLYKLEGMIREAPYRVAESLQGLDSEQAWKMRGELWKYDKTYNPVVAKSLQGLDSEQAWKVREGMKKEDPEWVVESLVGLDTERAWKMREELKEKAPPEVAGSLQGLDSEQAWKMREYLVNKLNGPYELTTLLK